MTTETLKLCLVDLNNGVPNEATRCFRRVFDAFSLRAAAANPGLRFELVHVQPRNLGELPHPDSDFVLSSGGPGAPTDGWDDPWCTGYRHFLDRVVELNRAGHARAPSMFAVCHSFEISVLHFGIARMPQRARLKFGVFPAYPTEAGTDTAFLVPFGDRLFAWEHRRFEAVDEDAARLSALGGRVLARESREGGPDKGRSLMAVEFAPGPSGTQFHPEADRAGVLAWIKREEHAEAVREQYGDHLYEKMLSTLADPTRLARTFAVLLPTWLAERFDLMAARRGLNPIGPPEYDLGAFDPSNTGGMTPAAVPPADDED